MIRWGGGGRGGYDKLHHNSQDVDEQELYTFDQVFSGVKNEKGV